MSTSNTVAPVSPFTPAQKAAVESTHNQTLVVAGPGSGKTTVIVARVVFLLNMGVDPAKIVLLTYTNAAAKEMQERIAVRLAAENSRHNVRSLGYVGTLHSYCLRLLERHGAVLGYRPGLGVLEEERADDVLRASAYKLGVKVPLAELKRQRDEQGTACFDRSPKTPATLALCDYYRQLREGNMSDFSGLLSEGARLWRMGAVPPLEHLLVDEYQDSTYADQDFYFAVQAGAFFFVGDPDQAVYAFRGGSVAAMLQLSRMESWHKVWLQENHRCDAAICTAAQRLIEHNTNRAPKTTVSATGGVGSLEVLPPSRTEIHEAATILGLVEAMLASKEVPARDVAILARTNAAVKTLSAAAQGGYNIPLARPVEEDALPEGWPYARATVDVLISPLNNFLFAHWLGLRDGEERARRVASAAALAGKPMSEVYEAGLPPLEQLGGRISAWAAVDLLARQSVSGPSLRRVEAFVAELPLDATLSDLSLAMRAPRNRVGQDNPEGVSIRTIHSAKGLEWPVVFVAALEQEVIPGRGEGRCVQEERRLMYVAATRAKHRLVLSYATSRATAYGKKEQRPAEPSQFFQELGAV